MLDDGIDRNALKIHEQTEQAFELGFENLEDYLLYLENEKTKAEEE